MKNYKLTKDDIEILKTHVGTVLPAKIANKFIKDYQSHFKSNGIPVDDSFIMNTCIKYNECDIDKCIRLRDIFNSFQNGELDLDADIDYSQQDFIDDFETKFDNVPVESNATIGDLTNISGYNDQQRNSMYVIDTTQIKKDIQELKKVVS
jgi:hypothetical protein